MQRVVHAVRLPQELRLPGDLDLRAGRGLGVEAGFHHLRRTDRDGGPADHQAGLGQQRRQHGDDRVDLREVGGVAALELRRTDADEVDIGPVRDLGVVLGEPQPAGVGVLLQQRVQPRFVQRGLAVVEQLEPVLVDLDADHVEAELGHPAAVLAPR